jgi:hypothetical protein
MVGREAVSLTRRRNRQQEDHQYRYYVDFGFHFCFLPTCELN